MSWLRIWPRRRRYSYFVSYMYSDGSGWGYGNVRMFTPRPWGGKTAKEVQDWLAGDGTPGAIVLNFQLLGRHV